jgi:hypothetical protein
MYIFHEKKYTSKINEEGEMLRDLAFKKFCYEVCVKQKKNARLFTTDPLSRLLVSIESGQHWIGPAAPRPISSSRGIAAMSHDSITSPMHSLCDEISLETADMSSFRNTTEGACHNIIATVGPISLSRTHSHTLVHNLQTAVRARK